MSINVYFLVVNDTYFVLTKHLFFISNFTIVLFQCFIVVVNIFGSIITNKNVKKWTSLILDEDPLFLNVKLKHTWNISVNLRQHLKLFSSYMTCFILICWVLNICFCWCHRTWCSYIGCWYMKQQGNLIPTTTRHTLKYYIYLIKQMCSYIRSLHSLVSIFNQLLCWHHFWGIVMFATTQIGVRPPKNSLTGPNSPLSNLRVGSVAGTHAFPPVQLPWTTMTWQSRDSKHHSLPTPGRKAIPPPFKTACNPKTQGDCPRFRTDIAVGNVQLPVAPFCSTALWLPFCDRHQPRVNWVPSWCGPLLLLGR